MLLVGGATAIQSRTAAGQDGFWIVRRRRLAGLDETYKRLFNSLMGRIAGLAAADTRERLLRAAADVFAERGYDGTRVADIAGAAGVSNGALYAHFASKADLLAAALETHGRRLLADMFITEPDRSITGMLLEIGHGLLQRRDARGYLVIEALVAARRDADVAGPMGDYMAERGDWLADLIVLAQSDGELDPAVSPNALAHFCLLLSMGSALVTPDLHAVDSTEWAQLLSRLVGALSEPSPVSAATADTGRATTGPAAARPGPPGQEPPEQRPPQIGAAP
jgi:AcrR family transcriptional regulator